VYRDGNDWTLLLPEMRNVTAALLDPVPFWSQDAELGPNPPKPDPYPSSASRTPIYGSYAGFAECPLPEALNQ
jgi:hypothetical protein